LLRQEGAVGDFGYCLFDAEGKYRKVWKFFVTPAMARRIPESTFTATLLPKGERLIVVSGVRKGRSIEDSPENQDAECADY
jgi:hypothetical protein